MISRIKGSLIDLESGRAHLKCGALVYEVLTPAADHGRLAVCIGETVELHTLHILEGNSQGSSFRPRLIGFASASDRAFFELFTTVKGIGARKALRIMEIPPGQIARAVHDRDVSLLTSLPEVGKRTAEAIIVELKEKVEGFLEDGGATGGAPATRTGAVGAFAEEAIAVLLQLGEPRHVAEDLVNRVTTADRSIDSADQVVTGALRLKQLN